MEIGNGLVSLKLTHCQYQRLASRRAGTRAFRQTFIAAAMNTSQTAGT